GFPAVADSSSYLRPMKYGDILEIKVYVSRVGTTSVTLEFEVARKETGELLARSTQTRVTVNMDTWEPISIPDRYRERLASCGPE
ncbi:MAG: acyl-CoA thioesterase, partial [Blastocatellia bacterium]